VTIRTGRSFLRRAARIFVKNFSAACKRFTIPPFENMETIYTKAGNPSSSGIGVYFPIVAKLPDLGISATNATNRHERIGKFRDFVRVLVCFTAHFFSKSKIPAGKPNVIETKRKNRYDGGGGNRCAIQSLPALK
jgi:hypothetical protein